MKVNIVPSETSGWIISRIVKELQFHNEWSVGDVDNCADINFFVNYHAINNFYNNRINTVTSALFTHPEDPSFVNLIKAINIPIFISEKYAKSFGGFSVRLGVDAIFRPKLNVGWVGNPKPSGRKGEFLIEKVAELPYVNFHNFAVLDTTEYKEMGFLSKLNKFYNEIDVLLVSSLVEGGPMPAIEAISMGKPVVGPKSVGHLSELNVLDYLVGNFASLEKRLNDLFQVKNNKSQEVREWTWENFCLSIKSIFNESV